VQIKESHLISIVDDHEPVREATASFIRSVGFRTKCFASAQQFLSSPHLHETDCLILDLQMPGMNGLELQRQLLNDKFQIPIIFVTAHGCPETRDEALRAGAIDFLSKPFSEEALLRAIQKALQVKKNHEP
jgi:FixJ family two-component response regulator